MELALLIIHGSAFCVSLCIDGGREVKGNNVKILCYVYSAYRIWSTVLSTKNGPS